MTRRKQTRKHRKQKLNKYQPDKDTQIRSVKEENTSINLSPILSNQTEFPDARLQNERYASLNYSGIKCLFSSRNGCYSSSFVEVCKQQELQSSTPTGHFITQTPRINREDFLNFSYNIDTVQCTPETYVTPLKLVHSNNNTQSSAVCMQDLNNLQGRVVNERIKSCSRILDKDRLRHLQNFNDIILNTSQSVNFENSECFVDLSPPTKIDVDDFETFVTPPPSNSTPISPPKVSNSQSVGTQTNTPKKTVSFSVNKRHSYRNLPLLPQLPPKKWPTVNQISIEHTHEVSTVTTEIGTQIISKIKKYQGRYSSHLPMKIVDICTWLGLIIKEGLISLYKFYKYQTSPNGNCNNCSSYITQIEALTSGIKSIQSEILQMKNENKENCKELKEALCKLEETIKRDLQNAKLSATPHLIPPPPPPPPPPPILSNLPSISQRKPETKLKSKSNEVSKPIISLEDILNVKLKKIGDRKDTCRSAEPNSNSFRKILKNVHQDGLTPSVSESSPSIHKDSNSPQTSLTRILSSIDTNVRRVKRLQRCNTYNSIHDLSRRGLLSKRERENDLENL